MPFVFPHFIMAANPHVEYDVGCGRENVEKLLVKISEEQPYMHYPIVFLHIFQIKM